LLRININIAIASAVTAYGRIHMSQFKDPKFMSKYDYNLYYSDTDSIYIDRPLPARGELTSLLIILFKIQD
jgi:hypothetical protein